MANEDRFIARAVVSEQSRWDENQGVHITEERRKSGDLPQSFAPEPQATEAGRAPWANLKFGRHDHALEGATPAGFANLRTGR